MVTTKKEFEDPDFVTLLRICNTKPQLLGLVNNYMISGTIVEPLTSDNKSTDGLSTEQIPTIDSTEFKYDEELAMLEKLGYSGDMVKSVITHFNGHLNLCIRYLNQKM